MHIRVMNLTIGVSLFCLMTVGPGGGCEDKAAPSLECRNPVFDFGTRDSMDILEHSFAVRNVGKTPLIINRVTESCRCNLLIEVTKNVIEPGDETIIHVRTDFCGSRGHINRKLLVESNDPYKPKLELFITGTVIENISIRPCEISFLGIYKDVEISKKVYIDVLDPDLIINVKRAESDSNYFVPEIKKSTIDRRSYDLYVRTNPPLPEGLITGSIRILTDNPKYSTLEIPVEADVFGELVIFPGELVFEMDDELRIRNKPYLIILSGRNQSFNLITVEPTEPSIETKIIPLNESGRGYRIELTALHATQNLDGKELRILTDVEGREKLSVPIKVLYKPVSR